MTSTNVTLEQKLHNKIGSFICTCITGNHGDDGVRVNECAKQSHGCDTNVECTDQIDSYFCLCNSGYCADKDSAVLVTLVSMMSTVMDVCVKI